MSQAHDAASGVTHSHKKHYLRIGAILTVITAIELALPMLKGYPEIWEPARPLWAPALIIMSVAKFGAVVGEFMHLRGDRRVYQFLFLSPLMLATVVFVLLSLLSVVMFRPFGAGYAVTAEAKKLGFVEASTGPAFDQPLDDAKFAAAFDAAKGKDFADGKKVFGEKCAACHGPQGGGMANLGLNLT
ncbi:MAG: cytochrome C oxidase subunit IV family protein, partial [Deltaproteobacteria bacterium]|nr:cytochrome C oxidase subunit IV family protein [Deltaproteobacteria bacterium]